MMTKIWISDGRKEYINAIQCLFDLLLPKFDNEMVDTANAMEKEIEDKRKEFVEKKKPEAKFIEYELKT
jgi:hypothetical protein